MTNTATDTMNRDNDIRRAFHEKLYDYQPQIPADGWERVEQSLIQLAARRRMMRRRWYAGSAAAMLLLLLGTLFFLREPMTIHAPMTTGNESHPGEKKFTPEQSSTPEPIAALQQKAPGSPVASPAPAVIFLNQGSGEWLLVQASSAAEMMEQWIEREKVAPEQTQRGDEATLRSLLIESDPATAGTSASEDEEPVTVVGSDDQLIAEVDEHNPEEERLMVGLSSKGGLSSFRQTVNSPMTLRSVSMTPSDQYGTETSKNLLTATGTVDNLSEMEHDQPISFGLTLSKAITDNLSIESGLTYTYLSSRLRNANANFRVEETQKIHYLGIPVNINYTLFTFNRFKIYASLGGMLEKDIYGEYRKLGTGETADFNSTAEEEEVTTISQRNPQISVHAGVGLSYPLIQKLRIYGKMGGAYYFDAGNQYKTIYSDRKIIMDLNIGLRYEF